VLLLLPVPNSKVSISPDSTRAWKDPLLGEEEDPLLEDSPMEELDEERATTGRASGPEGNSPHSLRGLVAVVDTLVGDGSASVDVVASVSDRVLDLLVAASLVSPVPVGSAEFEAASGLVGFGCAPSIPVSPSAAMLAAPPLPCVAVSALRWLFPLFDSAFAAFTASISLPLGSPSNFGGECGGEGIDEVESLRSPEPLTFLSQDTTILFDELFCCHNSG